MTKKQIKVHFADFWQGGSSDNFIVRILSSTYDIVFDSENPDYLFFSVFGDSHKNYFNCIKIFYSGENISPDFNQCDYGIGFDYMSYGDRYLRYPIHLIFSKEVVNITQEKALDRKFCNFVYSNSYIADPCRAEFFHKLSEYKHVDSGGRLLNNIGGPVDNKFTFIQDYKFTIAFENSSFPGYTTEKMIEPLYAKSIPIYWGNPMVEQDFNPRAFINGNKFASLNALVEEVKRLDNDDHAYLDMLNQPAWNSDQNRIQNANTELLKFIQNIIEQPIESARRRPTFGWVMAVDIDYKKTQQTKKPLVKRLKDTLQGYRK